MASVIKHLIRKFQSSRVTRNKSSHDRSEEERPDSHWRYRRVVGGGLLDSEGWDVEGVWTAWDGGKDGEMEDHRRC